MPVHVPAAPLEHTYHPVHYEGLHQGAFRSFDPAPAALHGATHEVVVREDPHEPVLHGMG